MRIKVIQWPSESSIDGVKLDRFVVGQQYELGTVLASVFLAEGWAEPVDGNGVHESLPPQNLRRDSAPHYLDVFPVIEVAFDRPIRTARRFVGKRR